ncbi:MAG: flagellar motor protein MotA [Desulfobacteraceae bacterium 4572_35.1]|nr:MAG: flagellar motor protein MotA [Desulfobacteraceae bacterium 4572_35.1]
MVPLMLVSLLMWGVILYRLLLLKQLYQHNITPAQACEWLGCDIAVQDRSHHDITSLLLVTFMRRRSGHAALDRYVLDEAAMVVRAELGRGLTLIGVLAAISPLLGLLGTVLGMIGTFDTIAIFGTGNARAMAGGISQALITTQTGLLIAIPGLYMRNFLQRRVDNLERRLESLRIYLNRYLLNQGDNHLAQEGR